MKIACVQSDVAFGDPMRNCRHAYWQLAELKQDAVDLAVFPEAFLTGYCVESAEDAAAIAIPMSFPGIGMIQSHCDELKILAVVGFAEREGGDLYNSAILFEPGREPRVQRKCHLPELGLDKHVRSGDRLDVFDTALGTLGILICFDMRPPEAARVLTLRGADLIVLPTNWPVGAEVSADVICVARAAENRVFFATCNRVGKENGFEFLGRSKIISPAGEILAQAEAEAEVITAEIDLAEARRKRKVLIPGRYEIDVLGSRRPELYSPITNEFRP